MLGRQFGLYSIGKWELPRFVEGESAFLCAAWEAISKVKILFLLIPIAGIKLLASPAPFC